MVINKYNKSTEFYRFSDKVSSTSHNTTNSAQKKGSVHTSHLIDNHGRIINYLRLAITDRCNLRCHYCLPAEGLSLPPIKELLTWEEMIRLCRIFVNLGIIKIRITGGEPFLRKGLIGFLSRLKLQYPELNIGITTNGILAHKYLDELQKIGIKRLNFSLDSLQEESFKSITGRSYLKKVMNNIEKAYQKGFVVKINMVVLPGINVQEIPDFVEWTRDRDWIIRFIEPMPFDTFGGQLSVPINGKEILSRIRGKFEIYPVQANRNSVDCLYQVHEYQGKISIINGFSRSFCQECSRVRVSSRGLLRTCLYGRPAMDLKEIIRTNMKDEDLVKAITRVMGQRKKNGFDAAGEQKDDIFDSMSVIGG